MKTRLSLISCLAGIGMGFLSTHVLFVGQWISLLVWSFAGIILGLFATEKKQMIGSGLWYGLSLSVSFLLSGYQGTADKLPGFLLLTLGLSVVGIAGGILCTFIGSRLRKLF